MTKDFHGGAANSTKLVQLLVDLAHEEEKLLSAVGNAVERGDRHEVFRLARALVGKTPKPDNSCRTANEELPLSPHSLGAPHLSPPPKTLRRKAKRQNESAQLPDLPS